MEYVLSIIGLPRYSLKRALAPLGVLVEHIHDHFIPHARNNYHPHILGHRALALMSGLLVAVKIFTLTALTLGPAIPAFSSAITAANIVSLTNQSRQEYSLAGLRENSVLGKAAQAKADDMLAKSYFSHNTPDGKTPWDFIVAAGYGYLMAGENLAVNFTEAENVETAWMNSPGHKANILNRNFEEIGIGISEGEYQGHTAIFVVQMFGTPAEQKIVLTNQPTPVQAATVPAPLPEPAAAPASKPQTLGDQKSNGQQAVPQPLPISVLSGDVKLQKDAVNITVQISGPAVKTLAYFGQEAVMLAPKSDGAWTGQISLANLAEKNASVKIKAYGMQGQTNELKLADFSPGTVENYNLSAAAPPKAVSFLGLNFDPKNSENRFYLFFMAGLLSSLVLAIAIKRHIQHLSLIANSSFVVILATLLWWAG